VTTEDASVADEVDRLTVRGLTRRFGALLVLDNVSFSVAAGSVLAVVGPNGAGKTTLLRCVAGSDRPDAGELLFDGRVMVETEPWLRAAVAAALDDIDFFADLSVIEHLDLLAFAHAAPAGQLLILDEPEQRLDETGRHWLRDRLLREKAAGTAVLMASHDPALVDAMADARFERCRSRVVRGCRSRRRQARLLPSCFCNEIHSKPSGEALSRSRSVAGDARLCVPVGRS
jgi:ABC-type multidrug transport system ATPase subunit